MRPQPSRLPAPLHRLLDPFLSQEPAALLIRKTARQQWRLIALNLGSSVVEAFSEGATLGVVFLAVEVLSAPAGSPFNWSSSPLLSWWPAAAQWLSGLPPMALFVSLLSLAVLLQALQSLTRFLNLVSVGYFAARCRALVTARIHSQVLSLSFPCASGYKVGDLTDYAGQGPEAIRLQIELTSGFVVAFLLIATYLAVLVGISPWLLLAVVVMAGLITLLQKQLLPRIRQGSKAVTQAQVAISTRITEDFQGLRLLHSSGQLEVADQRLSSCMGELERQLRGQTRRLAVVGPFSAILPILAIALIAALSLLLFGGRSTGVLPSLVTFVLALQRLNTRLSGLAGTSNQLADNSGRLERLNQILSPQGKQFRRLGGTPFASLEQEIRFEGVGFRYAPELPAALEDVCFCLPKGQMLALVGPSGAGKSSIADLLVGLYAPTAGQILIDDTPLEQLKLASWQQRLGVVSQDTFLFNASLAENIAFGTPGATRCQIEVACQAAQAAGFIESLPQGYDTLVGERGYRLSGGQRQRISLARAILRSPELLILDEATSALDSQSERLVQEALERFERGHTVLVIAHRLSTIVRADQILVLDHGQVVERGSHASLLAKGGLYRDLWQQQSQAAQTALT
ncbi:ABC transporter ATP-binding protein [Synechococcus sp. CBW1006]|nr:ABC transporter ATP-binding protein [Synechococcus sp. CBW1006]